ncbi:MAG: glycogen/starch/alpha-glucan phosphorylase, partial [Myxococcota bacterium]
MSKSPQAQPDAVRTGMEPETVERAVLDHLYYSRNKEQASATLNDLYHAVSLAMRDRLAQRWLRTARSHYERDLKRVYYLSAEFLMGRQLSQNLINLDLWELAADVCAKNGLQLGDILESEHDPGLGNGGLGRLAACFLDSMATLGIAGYGYGIRYEYGIFQQLIRDGWQVESGDAWLQAGNPWEIPRNDYAVTVNFYGRVEEGVDENGRLRARWLDTRKVLGTPYDTPVAGFRNGTVNTLRLWSARASDEFD